MMVQSAVGMPPPGTVDVMFGGVPAPLGPKGVPSAIRKSALPGESWSISATGLVDDRQADLTVHGGPDKAIHHYPFDHYALWGADLPQPAPALERVPAFGENISTVGITEANVCIGDVFRLGAVTLQVSQGRQPCWKLNALFGIDDMAVRVQKTGRTGWYYRVLETGAVRKGDVLTLIERPQPTWSLARIGQLLYTRTTAFDELAQLAEVPELANGWRKLAQRRVATRSVESWDARLGK